MIYSLKNNIRLLLLIAIFHSCASNNTGNANVIITHHDTFAYNGDAVYPSSKFDSISKQISKLDSFGIIFENGFNNTKVELIPEKETPQQLVLTTNNFLGKARGWHFSKKNSHIKVTIDKQKFILTAPDKYVLILINYDSTNEKNLVDYTNNFKTYR